MQDVTYAAAVLLYAVASGLHWDHLRRLEGSYGRVAWWIVVVALGLHLLGLIHVVVGEGFGALLALPALPSEVALLLAAAGVVLGVRTPFKVAGAFLTPVAMVLLATVLVRSMFGPGLAGTSPEAVRTALTPIHVSASVLGFLSFCASYAVAGFYVLKDARLRHHRAAAGRVKLPPLQTIERLMYRILMVGFVLYSLGAVLGALWAAGESGPGFEPKYTLAALSWLSFAFVLGLRWLTGWTGRRAAFLVAIGFVANLAVVMTYFARLV
jgi:ABC-type uncharacterized transport system permease subunit